MRHISQIIGDPAVFVDHMIKDAMRSPKDNLPPLDPSDEELNHNEYVKQWEKENNRCKVIQIGHAGHHKNQDNSSDKTSERCTQQSSKKHKTALASDAS